MLNQSLSGNYKRKDNQQRKDKTKKDQKVIFIKIETKQNRKKTDTLIIYFWKKLCVQSYKTFAQN